MIMSDEKQAQIKSDTGGGRLFQNPFLEKMSHTNPRVVIGFFVISSLAIITWGIVATDRSVMHVLGLWIAGLVFFTLVEYLMHRFMYHSGPDYQEPGRWQYTIHGIHHDYPKDEDRLAMPLPLAIMLASAFYLIFWLILGSWLVP